MTVVDEIRRPTAADFYAKLRTGELFTVLVNQRIAAYLSVPAERLGLPPTALTMINLVVGLGSSVLVIATAGPVAHGRIPAALIGLVALVLWQLAYSFDCADGQLARVTGQSSPAGARVDVLADVGLQVSLVAAVGAVAVAQRPSTPIWLVGAFAAAWMINMVTSVMAKEGTNQSLVTSRSLVVRLVKLIRDYGAMVALIGLVLAFLPSWMVWVMVLFTAVNCLFLLASIAQAARASLRATGR
jgi:phosphatidylglycerophosphate synthase